MYLHHFQVVHHGALATQVGVARFAAAGGQSQQCAAAAELRTLLAGLGARGERWASQCLTKVRVTKD